MSIARNVLVRVSPLGALALAIALVFPPQLHAQRRVVRQPAPAHAAQTAGLTTQTRRDVGGRLDPRYHPAPGPRLRRRFEASTGGLGPQHALRVPDGRGRPVGFLDQAHYTAVRQVGLEILRRYHPSSHFFVGVGRSPVALVTFLRLLNDGAAMTFPASDMRREIQPQWRQAYFEHFAQLIPSDVVHGQRTIVLFDRSRAGSGVSLSLLAGFLREWLATQGSSVQVVALGISPAGPLMSGVTHLDSSQHPSLFLYQQGVHGHDELVAPFRDKHRIGVHRLEQLQENPSHIQFRRALRQRMREDAELDRVLSEEFSQLVESGQPAEEE